MHEKKFKNFLEWNKDIFVNSLKKINLNIIPIVVLDALFYILSGYLIIFWMQRIQAKMVAFNIPSDITSLGPEMAQQLAGEVKAFYYLIVVSFALLLIAIIFLASIIKGAIWAKTTDTKITLRLISKFFGLNLVWMGFWIALAVMISLFVEIASVPEFMAISIILGLYFTNTLYTIFMKEQKFNSIARALKLNILKIRLFLLPYAVFFLLLYAAVKISSLVHFRYSQILLGFAALIYAAAARYYFSALVLEIERQK